MYAIRSYYGGLVEKLVRRRLARVVPDLEKMKKKVKAE